MKRQTMHTVLSETVECCGDNTAIITTDYKQSWYDFFQHIKKIAGLLKNIGLQKGDRYAVIGKNSPYLSELIHAGYVSGTVAVPINFRLSANEIRHIMLDANCKAIFSSQEFVHLFHEDEYAAQSDRLYVFDEVTEKGYKNKYLSAVLNTEPTATEKINTHDEALLLYTSGTTGKAKGVPLSHANLVSVAKQVSELMQPQSDDIYLHIAPMCHSADLSSNAYSLFGSAHCFLADPSPNNILTALEQHNVTITILPPILLIKLLQHDSLKNFDVSSLRKILFGSAPLAPKWIKQAQNYFYPTEIWHGYGLTETAQMLTLTNTKDAPESDDKSDIKIASCGKALTETELKIMNEDTDLSVNEIGEVFARGKQVFTGYLNRPEDTQSIMQDNWINTGDIGKLDKDGYLYLIDRKKDMVITGGENVYSAEVESVILMHDEISECAVIGVPDETYGEALLAVVITRTNTEITEENIIKHCREYLAGYKIPRLYEFPDSLPKNALGKILKSDLRKMYSHNTT